MSSGLAKLRKERHRYVLQYRVAAKRMVDIKKRLQHKPSEISYLVGYFLVAELRMWAAGMKEARVMCKDLQVCIEVAQSMQLQARYRMKVLSSTDRFKAMPRVSALSCFFHLSTYY